MTLVSKTKPELATQLFMYLSTLLVLIKSRTLVYAFALASIGTFLISSGLQIPDFLVLGRLAVSVYFLALATYLYNDLTDYEIDKVNNRNNSRNSKTISYRQILYSTIGFFTIAISLAFSINLPTGIASLVCLGLAMIYSHPSTHLKNMFVVKTVITSAGGFMASFMGALAVQNISYIGISSSIILFFMYFINGPLGDIGDMSGDKKGGRRTIPIVLGVNRAFLIILSAISSIAAILVMDYFLLGLHVVGALLGLVICASLIFRVKKLSQHYDDKKKISQTRSIIRLSVFTIQLSMFLGILLNVFLPM